MQEFEVIEAQRQVSYRRRRKGRGPRSGLHGLFTNLVKVYEEAGLDRHQRYTDTVTLLLETSERQRANRERTE